MSKITLNNVGNLVDATTAQTTINTNNAIVTTAFDNTLSRDGTGPNQMLDNFDMNGKQILNLPAPTTNLSPLRLQDLVTFNHGGTIATVPAGGTTGQALGKTSNADYAMAWQSNIGSVGLSLPNDFDITNSPITTSGTLTANWHTTPTGTGAVVRATSPTLTSPSVTGPVTITSASGTALAVGPNGVANPVFAVDGSATVGAGLKVAGAGTGGTVNLLTVDPGANNNLLINAKGTGTIGLGSASTGAVTITPPSTLTGAVTLGSTINKVTLTQPATAATLTLANNITVAGPATSDTLVGKATVDTLTNKTISASGTGNSINLNAITNSLSGDVVLNNTANYFDGPSIAQGTSGTWFVSGTVTVLDTTGIANFSAKLWDGTTVISSTRAVSTGTNNPLQLTLSGFITSPAANLRISCKDTSATTGVIVFNNSGSSKDSTITAIRVA